MVVTGGTYNINNGVVTFTNNTGGTFEVSGFTSGMTDSYTESANISASTESITFDSNLNGPNYYNVSLTPLLSGKTNNTTFSAYTSTTLTTLNGKVDSGLNVGDGEGVFRDKTGTTLNFKTIKSTGSTVDISNLGDEINLEVTHTTDTNGMFDSTNQGGTWLVSGYTLGNHTTTTMNGYNQIYGGAGNVYGTNKDFAISIGSAPDVNSNLYVVSTDRTYSGRFLNNTNLSGARYVGSFESSSVKTGATTMFGVISNLTGLNTGGTYYAGYFRSAGGGNDYGVAVPTDGGNSGFGTILPTATVQIGEAANPGTFKYVDGNQAADRILRSDGSGGATWVDIGSIPAITADTNIGLNNGSAYTTTITSVSGLTTSGVIESGTYTSGGTNLDQIFTQDAFTTFSSTTAGQGSVVADNVNDQINFSGININILTDDTTNTLTLSADTGSINTDTFVTGSTKEGNAVVVTRNDDVDVLTLSGGTNVTIVSGGTNLMRIDVSVPADTNTFVTGGTIGDDGQLVLEKNNDVDVDPIDFTETKRHVITADQALPISAGKSYLTDTGASLLSFNNSPASSDDEASFTFSVPSNYVTGGTFYLKITSLASTPPNNEIQYEMNITSVDLNGDLSTATDTGIQNVTSASTTSWEIVESPAYNPVTATFSKNKHVSVKINRDVSDAPDTYNGTAYVWGLVFEYTGIR
jgi:hypothetical protein